MKEVKLWFTRVSSSVRGESIWRDYITVSAPRYKNGGWLIDIDTTRIIAQFIVWPSWAYEASALAVESEDHFHFESNCSADERTVDDAWKRFIKAIERVETRK